jgi:lipopolysaccharide/colanic/teichoic acid biosynthesis glycosyltransferase
MAIVGPRPEVPLYVDTGSRIWKTILSVRPGITDPASLAFRDEAQLLAGQDDSDGYYRDVILPCKLEMSSAYLRSASFVSDIRIILQTIRYGLLRQGAAAAPEQKLAVRGSK